MHKVEGVEKVRSSQIAKNPPIMDVQAVHQPQPQPQKTYGYGSGPGSVLQKQSPPMPAKVKPATRSF